MIAAIGDWVAATPFADWAASFESNGKTMADQKKTQEKQSTALEWARAMKVRQAQQNARIREQKGQSQSQSRGM